MSQKPNKTDFRPTLAPFNMSVLALGSQVGCSTLFIVIVAVFGGIWLDRFLDTKPIFTILFILGSAPLALGLTYWLALRTLKSSQFAAPDANENKTDKEELTGE